MKPEQPTRSPQVQLAPPPLALDPALFVRLRDLLAAYSGVYLEADRQRSFELGLARRLAATGDDLARYESRLRSPAGHDELRRLAELVLNHETFFFRNRPHLRALQHQLLPELHRQRPPSRPIRIWSAGCSTGEEAYSLAIVALETFGLPLARPVEIWATDLSEAALQRARAGFYRGRTLNHLPPEILSRYFQSQGDGYAVGDALRQLVRFEALNLLEPFPERAQGCDVIFCQNVTIYFRLETCRQLIARFFDCLPPGGLLCLGFSETLWNIFDGFRLREVAGAYVYVKDAPPASHTLAVRRNRNAGTELAPRPTHADVPAGVRRSIRPFRGPQTPVTAHEPSDEALLRRGRELLDRGQHEEALEVLRRVSPRSACAPQACVLAARAHADRGDLDLAVAELHRALELDALDEAAALLLGVIYGRLGEWSLAVQQLERARYISPASALVSFHLADAYRQTGRAALAEREYRNTLRKLEASPPDALLDGVTVGWLRESCQRQIEALSQLRSVPLRKDAH